MPRVKLFFGEAFRSIGANLSTTVAATMTVLIGMFLLGLFIALFSWVNSWTDHVRKDVLVKVFFVRDASPSQINAVKVKLQTYITGCYGSLTSFNLLFAEEDDQFKGQGE